MDAAFLIGILFPPPPPGALALAGLDASSARSAADAGVPLGIQRMYWNAILNSVVFDLLLCPIRQRTDLDEVTFMGDLRHAGAGFALLAPEPHHVGLELFEFARERTDFTDIAAEHARRHIIAEQVVAVARHH